jgi:uncharacterized protein (TIGR02246 family)
MRFGWIRATTGLGLIVLTSVLATPLSARMQDPTEAELRRLAESYAQAWGKGDAKAVTGLYSTDAIRVGPDGKIVVGRARIEQAITAALTGPYRGTKINLIYGQTTRAAQDAYVSEGTWHIAGGMPPAGAPTRGRFLQTLVRVSGRWLIAGDGVLSPAPPAK